MRLLLLTLVAVSGLALWALAPPGREPAALDALRAGQAASSPAAARMAARADGLHCGSTVTSDRPAVEPGPAVTIAYVLPLDGEDRLAAVGPALETAVARIEAWWKGQDPGRVPRFDRYAASCGPQLDVATLRLDSTSRSIARFADISTPIIEQVAQAGLSQPFRTVLALYDGPGGLPDVCGEGGGELDGEGIGLVYLNACPGVSLELVLAHELVHALGALPPGAPHACPDDEGHPCDDASDVIWPYASARPLETLRLDVGRDDYYGHPGAQPDLRESIFLRRLDAAPTRVAIGIRGNGVVQSAVPGASCARSCVQRWDGRMRVTYRGARLAGQRFVRWEGDCSGRGACTLTLAGRPVSVTAVFAPPTYPLELEIIGRGVVRPTGRSGCGRSCSLSLPGESRVRLAAEPAPGWKLVRWVGACAGRGPACVVPMRAPRSVGVVFSRR